MARNDPTIYMRIPQELKDQLDQAAEENRRSLTAEVVARLKATFDETVVTTVEARAQPIADARFEFNADEIAQKVVEKLEGRKSSSVNKVIISGAPRYLPSGQAVDYLDHYYAIIRHMTPIEKTPRTNEPYGPKKSANAKKALPKR